MAVPTGRGMLSEKLLAFQQLPGSCLRLCFLSLSGSPHAQCCSVPPGALTDCWLLMGGVCVAAVCQGISWFPSLSLTCGWALGETWDVCHTVTALSQLGLLLPPLKMNQCPGSLCHFYMGI